MKPAVKCPHCRAAVAADPGRPRASLSCPRCDRTLELTLFPASWQPVRNGSPGQRLLSDEECSCYYHPHKRAVCGCDGCGRFVCALCEVTAGDQVLCPVCINQAHRGRSLTAFERERFLYDHLAIGLALVPLLMWPLTLVTAPAAVVAAFWFWRRPLGLATRSRWRFVVAILLAIPQLLLWGFFLAMALGGALA